MTTPSRPHATSLADVLAVAERLWPARLAEDWDSVGLICGDPAAPVRRVLFAVDPVATIAVEAEEWGAQLVVTHHPLFLAPVHSVAATTAKGRLVHDLVTRGIALFNAHTNADAARPGVSDALALALGLGRTRPLEPTAGDGPDGAAGDAGDPFGAPGEGRIGDLDEPVSLAGLAARVVAALPATACGVRVSGDRERIVRRVAVCGGSGGSLLPRAVALGADVYVTSDLRHHVVSENAEDGGPALIDVSHAAAESLWLPRAAADLADRLPGVECRVSTRSTDPWDFRA